MPLQASPFTSVPNGISYPATPPTSGQAAAALGGAPQGASPSMPPSPSDLVPPGFQGMQGAGQAELDLFQKVVRLLMDQQSGQLNPALVLVFAGMGLADALEKSGKYTSKPHRSNEELATRGYNVGMQGQTGVPSPEQLVQKVQPPSMPSMPGM